MSHISYFGKNKKDRMNLSLTVFVKVYQMLQENIDSNRIIYELGQYLYFEIANNQEYLFQISRPMPRQHLRTLLADAVGKPELADYNKYPN